MIIYQVTTAEDPANDDRFFSTIAEAREYRRNLKEDGWTPTDIQRWDFKPTREGICALLEYAPNR